MQSEAFVAIEFSITLYSSFMTRAETLLKVLVYSPFNRVLLQLAQDITHRMGNIGMFLLFTRPACVYLRFKRLYNFDVLSRGTYFV